MNFCCVPRWPFLTGNPLVAFNTGLVGLVSNSFFRRMLMVRQGLILSSLPMAVVPGITITLLYPTLISFPILTGDLNCPLCASMRGGLMGFTLGELPNLERFFTRKQNLKLI